MLIRHFNNALSYFFFQAEDGIRDYKVTGVQTCALPIYRVTIDSRDARGGEPVPELLLHLLRAEAGLLQVRRGALAALFRQIGRASCRERVYTAVVAAS